MKKYTLIIILMIIAKFSFSQNLVPNPSFEEHSSCNGITKIESSIDWFSILASPDYFITCDSVNIGGEVPYSAPGYQCSATGNAYVGIYTYLNGIDNIKVRDYFGTRLSNSLIKGKKYFVSFKLNLSNNMSNCSNSGIGVLFQTKKTKYLDTGLSKYIKLPNKSQVYSKNIITDTLGWSIIKGSFIADSNYQYIMIGNLFDENNILFKCVDNNMWAAYYYIDDICVSEDSLACENVKQQIIDFKADTTSLVLDKCLNLKTITNVNYKSYKWTITKNDVLYKSFIAKDTNICFDKIGKFTIKMIATNNNGCGDTLIKYSYINVYPTENIYNYEILKETIITPNPIKDNLQLSNIGTNTAIKIYDSFGRLVYTTVVNNDENINLSNLADGVYILQINLGKTIYNSKFLKIK